MLQGRGEEALEGGGGLRAFFKRTVTMLDSLWKYSATDIDGKESALSQYEVRSSFRRAFFIAASLSAHRLPPPI